MPNLYFNNSLTYLTTNRTNIRFFLFQDQTIIIYELWNNFVPLNAFCHIFKINPGYDAPNKKYDNFIGFGNLFATTEWEIFVKHDLGGREAWLSSSHLCSDQNVQQDFVPVKWIHALMSCKALRTFVKTVLNFVCLLTVLKEWVPLTLM